MAPPTIIPNRLVMYVPGLTDARAYQAATTAQVFARRRAPKMTGHGASRIMADWGPGWFGIHWLDEYLWFQEVGINPFTMRALAGKTVPMWIDDPTGKERQKNPKAKTRVTASGKTQVLIFRKAARMGQRKTVVRHGTTLSVPASYPGAPGRIGSREARQPYTTPGRVGGQIARGNSGVRWRHPGLSARSFLHSGMTEGARVLNLSSRHPIYALHGWQGSKAA